MNIKWLRIDWINKVSETNWEKLSTRLSRVKRNYFRYGLSLDADFKYTFLENEINANAMLYVGSKQSAAGINQKNFRSYLNRKYKNNDLTKFSLDEKLWAFAHEGILVSSDDDNLPGSSEIVLLSGMDDTKWGWKNARCLSSGHREIKQLNPDQVYTLIESSSNFLARQVLKDGKFIYGHFPCFGRNIPTYNTLRHASSIYSMLEAWELTRDKDLLDSIKRALAYLDNKIIRRYERSDGTTLAFNVDVSDEIKLGANAVSILALVKYTELTRDDSYKELMDQLALGIKHMQNPDTGEFVHVLNSDDLSVKEKFRIVYYDGEAAFGLMRLYGLTKDLRWINIVERAFEYFIKSDHWKHHDHWLSYCVNELTLYKPEEKYFRFGVKNVAGSLDFILTRKTTNPTSLELSMAFHAMLQRIQSEFPAMQRVLDDLDIDKFYKALNHRAHYLLNGFFWPELAMFYAKPKTIVGSFFVRDHSFRVRIDDVHHYLSGYVAYWKMLQSSM